MMSALRDHNWSSPLSQFEPTELFDSLSTGIVVLDQLVAVLRRSLENHRPPTASPR